MGPERPLSRQHQGVGCLRVQMPEREPTGTMIRFHQAVLIGSLLPASWLGMQAVHELGHVAGALLTGGKVARVVLHPMTISRTDLASNPSPLLVVWAGPVLGCLLPLAAW